MLNSTWGVWFPEIRITRTFPWSLRYWVLGLSGTLTIPPDLVALGPHTPPSADGRASSSGGVEGAPCCSRAQLSRTLGFLLFGIRSGFSFCHSPANVALGCLSILVMGQALGYGVPTTSRSSHICFLVTQVSPQKEQGGALLPSPF